MESREIVVKRIEVDTGAVPPAGGAQGRGPRSAAGQLLIRILAAVLFVALAVPAIVLGGACIVTALVVAIVLWSVRRIAGR